MKANRGQMERALDAPGQGAAADVRFFLLYGPDEAGSQALAKRWTSSAPISKHG